MVVEPDLLLKTNLTFKWHLGVRGATCIAMAAKRFSSRIALRRGALGDANIGDMIQLMQLVNSENNEPIVLEVQGRDAREAMGVFFKIFADGPPRVACAESGCDSLPSLIGMDDDGDMRVFACSKGHEWRVKASPRDSARRTFWQMQHLQLRQAVADHWEIINNARVMAPVLGVFLFIVSVGYSYRHSENLIGYMLNVVGFFFMLAEFSVAVLALFVALGVGCLSAQWIEFRLDPEKYADRPLLGCSESYRKYSWIVNPCGFIAGVVALAVLVALMTLGLEIVWAIPGFGWRAKQISWFQYLIQLR